MLLLDSVFWMFPVTAGGARGVENDQRREQEVKTMQEALMPLKTLKLDSSEYACLKAIILFRTSKLCLSNSPCDMLRSEWNQLQTILT